MPSSSSYSAGHSDGGATENTCPTPSSARNAFTRSPRMNSSWGSATWNGAVARSDRARLSRPRCCSSGAHRSHASTVLCQITAS